MAPHVKFWKIICINLAVPSCKTKTTQEASAVQKRARKKTNHVILTYHSVKHCGRDAIETVSSERTIYEDEMHGPGLQFVVNIILPFACLSRGQH